MDNKDKTLRELLVRFLKGETHMSFDLGVAGFPLDAINNPPPRVPYSPWHILEHIRRTQADILNFMTNPDYNEPEWPKDYWPGEGMRADRDMWDKTITDYHHDLNKLIDIAGDPKTELYSTIAWGDGQTVIEELMKAADHTSYHLGEFAVLRQVMKTWPKNRTA